MALSEFVRVCIPIAFIQPVSGKLDLLEPFQLRPDRFTHRPAAFNSSDLASVEENLDGLWNIACLFGDHHTPGIGSHIELGLQLLAALMGDGPFQGSTAEGGHPAGVLQSLDIGLINGEGEIGTHGVGDTKTFPINEDLPGLLGDNVQNFIGIAHGGGGQLLGRGPIESRHPHRFVGNPPEAGSSG